MDCTRMRKIVVLPTALLLCGCGLSQSKSAADVLISDGCMIHIRGIDSSVAKEIHKDWVVGDDCQLNVDLDKDSK